jgi:hypothetical protein
MERYYPLSVVVPEFTNEGSPVTQTITLENALLVDVEIIIPAGHGGLTGIRVRQSLQQILPWGNSSWIIADNYTRVFDINAEIGSRSISVQAFNDDTFGHTFFLRFHIRDLPRGQQNEVLEPALPLAGTIIDGELDTANQSGAILSSSALAPALMSPLPVPPIFVLPPPP